MRDSRPLRRDTITSRDRFRSMRASQNLALYYIRSDSIVDATDSVIGEKEVHAVCGLYNPSCLL